MLVFLSFFGIVLDGAFMKYRTPRNYSGTQNPAKKISEILPEVVSDLGRKAKIPNDAIFEVWNELIGEKMAPLTKPISFVDEVFTVKVKSSTLYSLLVTHEKPRLLGRHQKKFSIRNIIFRVG